MKAQVSEDKRWWIDPPDDVRRMMTRAMKDIAGPHYKTQRGLLQRLAIEALRERLKEKYARKKDLTQPVQ